MVADTAKFFNLPPSTLGADLLATERARASFVPDDLKGLLYDESWLKNMNEILTIVENDPAFDKSERYFSGRKERFQSALIKEKRIVELARIHKWTHTQIQIAEFLIDELSQFYLHRVMFTPTLMNQATDEQKKRFLEPALRYEIIGCYAQTELGHGSNVQGLETTATFIPETDEFEIHSPSLTASKWWIGGLGKVATHAVVMARLITQNKDYGPHPFIVQIRSLEDHIPLKGVRVGDIGPKFGLNTIDNGYIMFNHIRIPRFNMLARFSKVTPRTGEYVSPPNSKLSYGTMVYVRANIINEARFAIARATTIATRYTAIRRQFVDAADPKTHNGKVVETPVLDYVMVQSRILPAIAQAYACHFTGQFMLEKYDNNQRNMSSGDFSLLADLHSTSSGLKSLTTTMAAEAIEVCRRAMGGHGYSAYAGLESCYANYLPNVTWEGDNYLLTQQTARYLLKLYRQTRSSNGSAPATFNNPTMAYLASYDPSARCPIQTASEFLNLELVLSAFRHRAAHIVAGTAHSIDVDKRSWNDMHVSISKMSRAHSQLVLVENFATALRSNSRLRANKPIHAVMTTMLNLFALHTMENELADFLASSYISPNQSRLLSEQVLALLAEARPNAVALVDSWGLPDFLLHSALGRYDGKVYETMAAWAEKEPLNQDDVVSGYEDCIRPFIVAGNKVTWKKDGIAAML